MQRSDAQRAVAQACEICAILAPTFAEALRAERVAAMFQAAGLTPRLDSIGNVIAEAGPVDQERTVFAAHLDTVFDASTPIEFRQGEGRLAAPGIGDNSLGVAGLLHLARHLHGREPEHPVSLVATVGEEGLGDLRGAKALLQEVPCRAFVAIEGQMLDCITVAGVGSMRFQVAVRGPGGHPWSDRGTPSATHWLLEALAAVLAHARSVPDAMLNVGVLEGGTVINAIAAEALAQLDLRCEDQATLSATAERMLEILQRPVDGLEVTVQTVGQRPGGRIAADHPLLEAARAARRRAGLPAAEETASSTDANVAHGRGIPAVTVGVSTGANAHRLDEYIDLEPVESGLRSLTALLDELAGLG